MLSHGYTDPWMRWSVRFAIGRSSVALATGHILANEQKRCTRSERMGRIHGDINGGDGFQATYISTLYTLINAVQGIREHNSCAYM